MTDKLHPTAALSPDELARARQVAAENPDALLPALHAALDICKDRLDRIEALLREMKTCAH